MVSVMTKNSNHFAYNYISAHNFMHLAPRSGRVWLMAGRLGQDLSPDAGPGPRVKMRLSWASADLLQSIPSPGSRSVLDNWS